MIQIQLLVVAGDLVGQRLNVPAGGARIGRSSSCDFTINEGILSRQHCECYVQSGKAYVRDLASANGTLVNGEDIGTDERRLQSGDIITLGATALRVQLLETDPHADKKTTSSISLDWSETSDDALQTMVAQPLQPTIEPSPDISKQMPSAGEPFEDIDLGLGDKTEVEGTGTLVEGRSGKWLIRLVIVALVALIAMIGMMLLYEKLTEVKGSPEASLAEVYDTLEDTKEAPFDIAYEHLAINAQSIFAYYLTFSSTTGILSLRSESLGETDRSFVETKQLSKREIERLRAVFIENYYEKIVAHYPEQTTEPCSLDRKSLRFVLGRKIWERTSENYASHDYAKLCMDLEACAGDLLNLKAAQYAVSELLEFARGHLDDAEAYWLRIAQGDENLCKSYENYCEAEAYLRTINPKPDFAKEIQRGVDKTRALINERYDDYKLTVDQAYHSRDEMLEARALGKIMRLLPENDERYRQAEVRLEMLEGRRRY